MADTNTLPPIPDEFAILFDAAALAEPLVAVAPFPPRSWLYPAGPDGWSFGTDAWHLTLRPRLEPDAVVWRIEYHDDDGVSVYPVDVGLALRRLCAPTCSWAEVLR
jgi:hypothetical protein